MAGYFVFDPLSNDNIIYTTSDLDATGNIEVIVYALPYNTTTGVADWSPGAGMAFISKGGATIHNYKFQVVAGGTLRFSFYNGTSTVEYTSTAAVTHTTSPGWVRMLYSSSGNTVDFYESTDSVDTAPGSVSWSAVGTQVATAGSASTNNDNVQIGRTSTTTNRFRGRIYVVHLILGGANAADPDFRTTTQGDWADCQDGGIGTPVTDGQTNSWQVDDYVALTYVSGGTPLTLTPNADGTITGLFNETHQTTNLYQSVDEWPETATDWVTAGENDADGFFDLTATPTNFGLMDTLKFEGYVRNTDFGADTCDLYAQVFKSDETTPLTDELLVGDETSDGLLEPAFTLNAAGLAATKTDWDAARVKLRWDYTP